jgi:hypothetical protein
MDFTFSDGVNNINISRFGEDKIMITRNGKDSIVEHLAEYIMMSRVEMSKEEEGFILGCGLSMLLVNVVDYGKMQMIKNILK